MRLLSGALGVGTILFGALPALFPQRFGRLFGVDAADNPTVATAIRSVGIRDFIIGVGLVQAARERNRKSLNGWLRARAGCDAGDTLAVCLAVAAGARNPRFLLLGALAGSATLVGVSLERATRPH